MTLIVDTIRDLSAGLLNSRHASQVNTLNILYEKDMGNANELIKLAENIEENFVPLLVHADSGSADLDWDDEFDQEEEESKVVNEIIVNTIDGRDLPGMIEKIKTLKENLNTHLVQLRKIATLV